MNDKAQVYTVFKKFMWSAFVLAIIMLAFIVLTPELSHSQKLCNLYRNIIGCYKAIALVFSVIGLIGLYIKQQMKLSVCVLILGLINGVLSNLFYFSSACIFVHW